MPRKTRTSSLSLAAECAIPKIETDIRRRLFLACMAGAACAEWHLHAWDLARALGASHRPADPEAVLIGWQAGMVHRPAVVPGHAVAGRPGRETDPWHVLLLASGRLP